MNECHHDVVAKVGAPAPDFELQSTRNLETLKENVKLADYRGKWLVMFFYPLDFTFVCPTEIRAFSDATAQFRKAGAGFRGVD
jgi:peroxiredoxin (alkyl hydroperoxide reductase subunit C)